MVNGLINHACDMKPHLKTLDAEIQRTFLLGEHIDVHQVRWHLTREDRTQKLPPDLPCMSLQSGSSRINCTL